MFEFYQEEKEEEQWMEKQKKDCEPTEAERETQGGKRFRDNGRTGIVGNPSGCSLTTVSPTQGRSPGHG